MFSLFFFSATTSFAGPGTCDGPEDVGNCVNGRLCQGSGLPNDPYEATGDACGGGVGSDVIGRVDPPMSVRIFNNQAGGSEATVGVGILVFFNRIVLLVTIVAGIFVMFNFIRAGWMFLLAGDNTKATGEVKDLLTYSVIGLVIIAVTYTIAGLIGLIFFGDAGFILNPQLYSAVQQ